MENRYLVILAFIVFFLLTIGPFYLREFIFFFLPKRIDSYFDNMLNNNKDKIGKTATRWFEYKIVRYGLVAILLFAFITLGISLITPKFDAPLGFLVELSAVLAGMIFSFYYNDAHIRIGIRIENKKIFYAIIDELKENKVKLMNLYTSGGYSYLNLLMKTTVWDVYKDKLGRFGDKHVNDLTDIYYKLITINENIKRYPMTSDYKGIESSRHVVYNMKIEVDVEIDSWIKNIEDFYKENSI